MNDLGEDLKEVSIGIGVEIDVISNGGVVGRTYTILETSGSNPNIVKLNLPYSFKWQSGVLFRVRGTGQVYILATMSPVSFENAVVEYDCTAYLANTTFDAFSIEMVRENYQQTVQEELVVSGGRGFMSPAAMVIYAQAFGLLQVDAGEVFVTRQYGIGIGYRLKPLSGKALMVTGSRQFSDGVDVLSVGEDARG